MPAAFLDDLELRPLQHSEDLPFAPRGFALGQGAQALEVVVADADARPTATELRRAWLDRHGGRPVPLLFVVLHDGRASICGPAGEKPPVYQDREREQVERLCRAALESPGRHAALALLRDALPETASRIPGVKNAGLVATHELEHGVPERPDWAEATELAGPLLDRGGRDVLAGMGYAIDTLPGPASVLVANGTRQAIAVFVERGQSVELASQRFSGLSPISYALDVARQQRLPWVVVGSDRMLRLYPAEPGTGVASRGGSETYVQLRLDLLRRDQAGYLWLLFSPDALGPGGTLEEILATSRDYAANLSGRLRERIYDEVVPRLAESIARARGLTDPTQEQLEQTYEMALLVLFRLLFVAYAEDQRLLPYDRNESYRARSLKQKARELLRIVEEDGEYGETATHWREVDALFEAVREGNPEWDVPQYDGALFSVHPAVSPSGAALGEVELSNREFGPALANLLLDEGPDGLGPIDFRSLGVREFGTIYEGLLESELSVAEQPLARDEEGRYVPAQDPDKALVARGEVYLHDTSGRRKSTGTYYTKTFAVEHLLEHALEPALERHVERLRELDEVEAAERFFDFRVADIAMGSGHFLIAAVDHIERRLTQALRERRLPGVRQELERLRRTALRALGEAGAGIEIEDGQLLRRQIARRCIYGVDANPVAVQLCRLSLWIHTFVAGLPLSFLDRTLVHGDSLTGAGTVDDARHLLDPSGESSQADLFGDLASSEVDSVRDDLLALARSSDATDAEIEGARAAYVRIREGLRPLREALDIAVVSKLEPKLRERWRDHVDQLLSDEAFRRSIHEASLAGFALTRAVHFPLEFSEVFYRERPGFDCVIGNPPWEKPRVEEHAFWARHEPGLRGLRRGARDELISELGTSRPDLVRKLEHEHMAAAQERKLLRSFPGMDTGHPDLFRAFTWRFHQILRGDGFLGVVLPGDAFKVMGGIPLRELFRDNFQQIRVQFLTNNGGWVFEDVHGQKLIALVSARHGEDTTAIFQIPAECHDPSDWKPRGDALSEVTVSARWLGRYSPTLVLPILPGQPERAISVLDRMLKSPRISTHSDFSVARVYADFETYRDRTRWSKSRDYGYWPVYKGASFDLWEPDTGIYYAYTEGRTIAQAVHERRERANRASPYYLTDEEWRADPATHPVHAPRIAMRHVTNRTNRRTLIACLIPPRVITTETAPWILWYDDEERERKEAFLLGCLASLTVDWWARRYVEGHFYKDAFDALRVPHWDPDSKLQQRLVKVSGRLAASDERFETWARAVGVSVGTLDDRERDAFTHEIDALVPLIYGLSVDQLRFLFETFHEGWEYEPRLEAVLKHYERWRATT